MKKLALLALIPLMYSCTVSKKTTCTTSNKTTVTYYREYPYRYTFSKIEGQTGFSFDRVYKDTIPGTIKVGGNQVMQGLVKFKLVRQTPTTIVGVNYNETKYFRIK